jgi:hypothetical protein
MSVLDAVASRGPAAAPDGTPGGPRDEWAREAATAGLEAAAAVSWDLALAARAAGRRLRGGGGAAPAPERDAPGLEALASQLAGLRDASGLVRIALAAGAPGNPHGLSTDAPAVWAAADAALSLAAAADGGGHGDEDGATAVRGHVAPELAATLFVAALEALRAPPKAQLLPALRCARGVWRRLLADPALRPLVSMALPPPAPPPPSAKEDAPPALPLGAEPLSRCAAALAAALFSGLQRAKKRSPAAVAAFVNTALLPAAFASREAAVLALHGPDGPLRWLTRRLVEEGGRSARLMSLVGLALAPALAARPALLGDYRPELRRILLFGVRRFVSRAPQLGGRSCAEGAEAAAPPACRSAAVVPGSLVRSPL